MVPDSDASEDGPSRTARSDAPPDARTPDGGVAAGDVDADAYDVVYRATRDAIWDVVGTATLILFYLALAAVGLSIAIGGIGPFVRGSGSVTALAVGVLALVAGVFAGVRVYRLVTE
jgi:hypothetical protein